MKIQKAQHLHIELEKARPKCFGHKYALMEKYDGWYTYLDLHPNTTGHFRSRAERIIPSFRSVSDDVNALLEQEVMGRIICEAIIPDMEFAELNGIFNRQNEQANPMLIAHDFIPAGGYHLPFYKRYELLKQMVDYADLEFLKYAPIIDISDDMDIWYATVQGIWARNGEGLILKRYEAPYGAAVRNYDLMKIKEELTLDLLVIGYEMGQGKYEGTLGALIVAEKSGHTHKISGMTDSERDYWHNNFDEISGKVVEVKAMKRLPDGSLREPRFKSVRHDKASTDID